MLVLSQRGLGDIHVDYERPLAFGLRERLNQLSKNPTKVLSPGLRRIVIASHTAQIVRLKSKLIDLRIFRNPGPGITKKEPCPRLIDSNIARKEGN